MKLTAYNPSTDNLEMSYLNSSYSVGTTTIKVRNTDRFSVSDRILLGKIGFEQSEIVTVSAVNADNMTLTISATSFPHSADDAVYVLKYDQVNFYRSTSTVDGIYTIIATVNLDVDNANDSTAYEDASGLTSYFYNTTYSNSVTMLESDHSDPISGQGYLRNQAGHIVDDFLTEVGDTDQVYMSVPQSLNVLNECNDDLSTQSAKPYRTLRKSILLDITAATDRIPIPSDVLAIDRIKYQYINGVDNRTDNIIISDIEEIEYLKYDNNAMPSDELVYMAIDDTTNELVLWPTPNTTQTQKIKLYYWQKFPDFTGLATTINLPTPRVYKLFLCARFYRMRGLHDQSFLQLADRYAADYATEVVKLQRINRLDRGSYRGYRPDTRTSRQLRKY